MGRVSVEETEKVECGETEKVGRVGVGETEGGERVGVGVGETEEVGRVGVGETEEVGRVGVGEREFSEAPVSDSGSWCGGSVAAPTRSILIPPVVRKYVILMCMYMYNQILFLEHLALCFPLPTDDCRAIILCRNILQVM